MAHSLAGFRLRSASSSLFPVLFPSRPATSHGPTLRANLSSAAPSPVSPPSTIAVVGGGGKMGTALITGLLAHPQPPHLIASSPRLDHLSHLPLPSSQKVQDNSAAAAEADVILLCVKPALAAEVLKDLIPVLKKRSSPPAVVSVAVGLTVEGLSSAVSGAAPVARAMPSVAAAVRKSCTALAAEPEAEERAMALLGAVGDVVPLPERLFGAATALSGSGVAYLFMAAEALADAGVRHGLPREDAMKIAAATIAGAGSLLQEGEHPAVLRNSVESPGGTTIAATAALEDAGFRTAIGEAVDAAVDRGDELESLSK